MSYDQLPKPPQIPGATPEMVQWLEQLWEKLNGLSTAEIASVPVGVCYFTAGAAAPAGYLLCDGTAVSRTTYADLFDEIGTAWDTFNGAAAPAGTDFRVPDLRGRVGIGVGSGTGLTARALAEAVGAETHQLTLSEIPAHSHNMDDNAAAGNPLGNYGGGPYALPSFSGFGGTTVDASDGGDGAHNNMQPSAAMNWIIKA